MHFEKKKNRSVSTLIHSDYFDYIRPLQKYKACAAHSSRQSAYARPAQYSPARTRLIILIIANRNPAVSHVFSFRFGRHACRIYRAVSSRFPFNLVAYHFSIFSTLLISLRELVLYCLFQCTELLYCSSCEFNQQFAAERRYILHIYVQHWCVAYNIISLQYFIRFYRRPIDRVPILCGRVSLT